MVECAQLTLAILALCAVSLAQDVYINPNVRKLQVWEGSSQTVDCYTISDKDTVDLSWENNTNPQGPKYTVINTTTTNRDGTFTINRTLTFQSFKSSDVGVYTCTLRISPASASQIQIELQFQKICDNGKYGLECSSYCSEFCKDDVSGASPCNHINGSCLFGCRSGYTGAQCLAGTSESEPKLEIILGVVIPIFVLIVIGTVIIYHYREKICQFIRKRRREQNEDPAAVHLVSPPAVVTTTTTTLTTAQPSATTTNASSLTTNTTQAQSAGPTSATGASRSEDVADDPQARPSSITQPVTTTVIPPTIDQDVIVPTSHTPSSHKPSSSQICSTPRNSPATDDTACSSSTILHEVRFADTPSGATTILNDSDLTETNDIIPREPRERDVVTKMLEKKLEEQDKLIEEMKASFKKIEAGKDQTIATQKELIEVLKDNNAKKDAANVEQQKKLQTEKVKRTALARQLSERRESDLQKLTDSLSHLQERFNKVESVLNNESVSSGSQGEYTAILQKEFNNLAESIRYWTDALERKKQDNESFQYKYDLDSNRKQQSRVNSGDGSHDNIGRTGADYSGDNLAVTLKGYKPE